MDKYICYYFLFSCIIQGLFEMQIIHSDKTEIGDNDILWPNLNIKA